MDSETSVESQAAAALPSPMDSPSRAAGAAERSSSPTSPAPPGISTTVGPTGSGQQQAHVLLHGQQLQQAPLSIAASSLPTPSSSPPSLQHLQNQQAQQQAVPPISNADLLKYLAANGLNPADLEAILRQRAYQQQLAQAQGAADVADLEDRLNRRFGDLDLDGRNAMGYQQQLEEQRWLRQQQQQYRMQQEAALRGVPGSINAGRRQELMDPYEDLVMPSTGRMSPTGGRGYHPSMGSTALANNYENGISGTGSQASYDALRDGGVAPDSYANSLGGAFLNNLYGPGALNAYAASQQRKPFHQRDLPNVTPPEGYVCKLCFVEGHFLRHCPLYKERPRGEYDPYRKMFGDSVPPENYLCKLCFIPGHWMKNCALYKERNPVVNGLNANAALAAYRNGVISKADLALVANARMAAAYGYRNGMAPPGLGPRKPFSTVPPEGYVCKICSIPGHWIQQCPLKHTQPPPHYQGLLAGERMAERLLA